jgi:small redox-active disulfide protein 2
MLIQICGPGCVKCNEAEKTVKEVLAEAKVDARVEKVTDFQAIARLGVFSTPAVVIDGQIKCVGKAPTASEVRGWLP